MWEAIAANRRRSAWLLLFLLALLCSMGFAISEALAPGSGLAGLTVAAVLWAVLLLASLGGGEQILLASAGASRIDKSHAPQLFNVVEEMQIASGLPVMPAIYIIDSPVPNAFAVGLKPERSAVAVTSGLLAKLKRDELQGVIAHELAHVENRDTLFLTLAGVTLGAVVMLSDFYLRHIRFTAPRTRNSGKEEGAAVAVLMLLALLLAIVGPLLAQLLYFACSRKREYLADACSARSTRYPEGLASALSTITASQDRQHLPVNRTLAPMYIVNPLAAAGSEHNLFSTHPPTASRIQVLLGMAGEYSLQAYDRVFRQQHRNRGILGRQSLSAEAPPVPAGAAGEKEEKDPKTAWRDSKEILHRLNGYFVLPCDCGARLKIPPEFTANELSCPHCRRRHPVDRDFAEAAQALDAAQQAGGKPPPIPGM